MQLIKFDTHEFYHIYNHAIGNELLFRNEKDYHFFKTKMKRYLEHFCHIIVYCLLPNHFHILIKITNQLYKDTTIEQTMKNFFNSYTRSYNIAHQRTGRLFRHGYKSKIIDTEDYLKWLIYYIHRNPVHHGFALKCNEWKYSTYNSILKNTNCENSIFIYDLFGSKTEFENFTEELTTDYKEEKYLQNQIEFI